MAVKLKSDNRQLVQNSEYSYLVDNYATGVASLSVTNTEDFAVDDFILVEDIGKETAEVFRIASVNTTTGALGLHTSAGVATTTKFAHPESTKVYVLPYNQIRFYWTAAAGTIADENPTFASTSPLTDWVDVEPSSWYTSYSDTTNSTGFGWFVYRNSLTNKWSSTSNPIPYAGFSGNTVAQVFSDFDSLLNTNELRLVSMNDKFSWLNEALTLLRNKLNLSNHDYYVSEEQTLSIVDGTAEYELPADFSDMVTFRDNDQYLTKVAFKDVQDATYYTSLTPCYYLRGRYLGIVPTPTENDTYYYRYRAKTTTVSSLSTYIDLPDNAFYSLKDFMCYRAYLKFQNPIAQTFYQAFINSVNLFVQSAVKRDSGLDSWTIETASNT